MPGNLDRSPDISARELICMLPEKRLQGFLVVELSLTPFYHCAFCRRDSCNNCDLVEDLV